MFPHAAVFSEGKTIFHLMYEHGGITLCTHQKREVRICQ